MALTAARARRGAMWRGGRLLSAAVTLALALAIPAASAHALRSPIGEEYLPQGIAYDANSGTLYSGAAGGPNCRVVAVSSAGVVRWIAGAGICGYSGDGGPATAARIEPPQHLAVDGSGNLYAAAGYTVRRISHSTGVITDYAGNSRILCLIGGTPFARVGATASAVGMYTAGLAIDPISGNLYAADMCTHSIVEIDESGVIVGRYGGSYPNEARGAIAFDSEGDLYFSAGTYGEQVRKMDPEGNFSLIAGNGAFGIEGNGGPATLAQLDSVNELAVDSRGVLFIATENELRMYVRQVSPEGTIDALAGTPWPNDHPSPPGTPARSTGFWRAGQLAVDDSDNLYVSDSSDRTLFVIRGPAEGSSPTAWILHEKIQALSYERQGGGNPSESTCDQGCVGDPVSTATGEYSETTTDLAIPGRGPALAFARTYSSLAAGEGGPFGNGWTGSYFMSLSADEEGVVTIRQENGSQISFEPNGRGGYLAAGAYLATLAAREGGGYTLTRRGHDRFVFDAGGRLVRELDPNEEATTLSYTEGVLTRVTDAAGRTLTLSYGEGRVREVRDSAGRVVRYGYTGSDLTSVVDARGDTWTYTYDGSHRLLRRTDPNRHVNVANEYDAAGRVTAQTDAKEGVTRFSYRPGMTQITSPARRVRQDWYASGQLIRRVEAAGTAEAATWEYEYDPVTRGTTKVTDPNGHVWRAAYNAAGLRTSTTDPLEHTTSSTYDELGDRLTFTDGNSITTTWTYDERGNLLRELTPLTGTELRQVTTFTHGEETHPGDITAIEDPRRKTTQLRYDANGNLTSIRDPSGDETTMTYDEAGNLRAVVSPLGNVERGRPEAHTTTYAHDAVGALTQITDALRHVTRWSYDAAGNLESTTDAKRHTTTYDHDAADLMTTLHRANRTTLRRSYDADGNLESTTDGAGNATTYTYDDLGLLRATTFPGRHTTTYQYDGAGNTTSIFDPQRRTTTYGYDDANELTSISYSDRVTPNVTFGYDADGQRTAMTDGNGSSSYSWDSLHRLRQFTEGGTTIRYGYDLASNVTSIDYPNGTVTRGFDEAGRLEEVTDWLRATTRFGYDADSNLVRATFPAASEDVDTYGYDVTGALTSATFKRGATTLASLGYLRDEAGLQTRAEQTGLPGSAAPRTVYTTLNQLSEFDLRSYEYDTADNVTQLAGARPLAYNEANELREGPVPPGGTGRPARFGYDSSGNRTSATPERGTATRYGYDQADRLTSYTPPSGTSATYAYNGDGVRTGKTIARVTEHFLWDKSGGLPLLLADATNSYLYGPGGVPIEQINGSREPTYLHHDALGSTRLLTEARGATSGTFTYHPYGLLAGSTGTQTTPLGFAGQYTDAESGLQYLRARYHDPATGQFITRDPITAITGEPYAYAGGNPLAWTDPSGLEFLSDAIMVVSDAAAGALNEITWGLSNRIVGVNGSCAGWGYGAGGIFGFAGSFFTGGGEAKLAFGAERAASRELVYGAEHGQEVLGLEERTFNHRFRSNTYMSVHVDRNPTRHGGPHFDIHRRKPKTKIQWPLDDPLQFPG